MSTQIDWRAELDSSFGAGADRPPTDYLVPARAALRRRRTAMGAAVLATVIVVGGIGWAVMPDDGDARSSDIATDPDKGALESPTKKSRAYAPIAERQADVRVAGPGESVNFEGASVPVASLGSGELIRKAGWDIEAIYVLERKPRSRAWGISAVPAAGGEAVWMILTWSPRTAGSSSDTAGKRFAVFEDWMNTTWAEQHEAPAPPVSRTVGGQLWLAPGVTALETVEHPAEAAAYGPVDDYVAAKLRLETGVIVFALVGPDGGTTVDPAVLDEPTMAAFLAHLRAQGDNGEGLR